MAARGASVGWGSLLGLVLGLFGGLVPSLLQASSTTQPTTGQAGEPLPLESEVLRAQESFSFSVVAGEIPRLLFVNRRVTIPVELRNDSSIAWTPERGLRVSYHWMGHDERQVRWDGLRTTLTQSVLPGQSVVVGARVDPPLKPGRYGFRWDMVEEQVGWFSQRDTSPEPLRQVLVLPHFERSVGTLPAVLVALAGLAGLVLGRRFALWYPIACTVSHADLIWCGVALFGKPFFVVGEAALALQSSGHLVTLAVVALLLTTLLMVPERVRPMMAWGTVLMASIYVWGDLLYYRFFDDLASLSTLMAAPQLGELGESIRFLSQPRDALLAIDLVVALVLVLGMSFGRPSVPGPQRRCRLVLILALMGCLLVGGVVTGRLVAAEAQSFRRTKPPAQVVIAYGLYGYQVRDLVAHLGRRLLRRPLGDADLDRIVRWFELRAPVRRGASPWFGAAEKRNLVMLQVESLQSFVLDLEIGGQEITPHLNRLASQAISFADFHDQTSKGRSSDADFVTLVSILPVADSVGYEFPANRYTSLAHLLAARGYQTVSAIPFKRQFWNRQITLPAYGFAQTLFREEFEPGERIGWGLNDRDFLRQMVPRIAELQRPFCVYLTTLSLHYPFSGFPERHKVLDLGRWEGTSLGNYLHGMHFFDLALADFMSGLEASGLLDEAVLALWGDHDSGLHLRREFDEVVRSSPRGPLRFLADRVPFLIWLPAADASRGSSARPAGHLDIAPTLLALLGVDPGPYALMGRNLLGMPGSAPVAHPRGNWVDDDLVFLGSDDGPEAASCWDRRTLQQVEIHRCREGTEAVDEQLDIARLVLRYDLQEAIATRLTVGTPPRPLDPTRLP